MPVRNLDVALSDYTGCLCKRSFKAPQVVLFGCVRRGSRRTGNRPSKNHAGSAVSMGCCLKCIHQDDPTSSLLRFFADYFSPWAKLAPRTMASRHGRGRINRGTPRRACNCRTCKQQANGGVAMKQQTHGGAAIGKKNTRLQPKRRQRTREQKSWEAQTRRDICEKGNDV
jgi:hypothetical protein